MRETIAFRPPMFGFFKRLFGSSEKTPAAKPEDHFRRLNEVAPLRTHQAREIEDAGPAGAALADRSFVCREPVLDRNERIAGYEFNLSRKLQTRLLARSELVQKVYDDALLRNLETVGIGPLLGHRIAFVHLSPHSLQNPLLDRMPVGNLVLLIDTGAATTVELDQLSLRLAEFRARGLRYGWLLHRATTVFQPLVAAADFVQIETTSFDGLQLDSLVAELRRTRDRALPPICLIARDLLTHDDFNACFKLGFDHFQGAFVASRDNWHVPPSDINRLRVMQLLNLIRSGSEFAEIAENLKTEPVVSFKLLRYINSPVIGMQREITSIAQGLTVLGRDKIYRWLSLLLFDSRNPGYRERLITEQALTRAKFMESLAGYGSFPSAPDHLFMTGLFSLLDSLMGQSMVEMLKQVTLPEEVAQALLNVPGIYRDCLRLAMAMESNDPEEIAPAADLCAIDDTRVSLAMIDALTWAQMTYNVAEG